VFRIKVCLTRHMPERPLLVSPRRSLLEILSAPSRGTPAFTAHSRQVVQASASITHNSKSSTISATELMRAATVTADVGRSCKSSILCRRARRKTPWRRRPARRRRRASLTVRSVLVLRSAALVTVLLNWRWRAPTSVVVVVSESNATRRSRSAY